MVALCTDCLTPHTGRAGFGQRPDVLGWVQARWQDWQWQDLKKYNWIKYCMWMLVLVVVVALLISVIVLSTRHANQQSTPNHKPTNIQQPTLDRLPATNPLSLEEQYKQEQQRARCQVTTIPVDVTDQVKDLLPENDEIKNSLLPVTASAKRCRGLCDNDGYCLLSSKVERDIVVQYIGDNGTIMFTKRKIQDHTDCMCEAP